MLQTDRWILWGFFIVMGLLLASCAKSPNISYDSSFCDNPLEYPYAEQFQITDKNNIPIPSIRYKITTSTNEEYSGITDENGRTQKVCTPKPQEVVIEIYKN